jgi:hypothetical protein
MITFHGLCTFKLIFLLPTYKLTFKPCKTILTIRTRVVGLYIETQIVAIFKIILTYVINISYVPVPRVGQL